ncbi:MAG TPA: prephenate dehydrogenase [Ramlibacter sp.]|nr:prephenate dehydrogenase [Ramlibacter sp.]
MEQPTYPCVPKLDRIAVCGLGLIGGSVLKALQAARHAGHLTGYDIDPCAMRQALQGGWIHQACDTPDALFADNDLVVLCQPVGALVSFAASQQARIAAGRAIVVDVASVKGPVARALQGSEAARHFVPCHPIAGRAAAGWGASQADLFQQRLCIMTPGEGTSLHAIAFARAFWALLGSRVCVMEPGDHDRVYAAISHMPQVLSYAYLHSLATRADAGRWLDYRGTGFETFSRLGASDAQLWADIAAHNAQPVIDEIDRITDALGLFRHLLAQQQAPELAQAFALAQRFHARTGQAGAPAPHA